MYVEEQRAESAKVAGMRADNADSHDIQHAVSGLLSDVPASPLKMLAPVSPYTGRPELVMGERPRAHSSGFRRMSSPKQP